MSMKLICYPPEYSPQLQPHEMTEKCCMCCNNTAKSRLLYELSHNRKYFLPERADEIKEYLDGLTEEYASRNYLSIAMTLFRHINLIKIAQGMGTPTL